MENFPLPYSKSWWIQPGKILGGCYPGDLSPEKADKKLQGLLDVGIRTIICLQQEHEMNHVSQFFVPYAERLKELAKRMQATIDWYRFPIKDDHVPTPLQMEQILATIRQSLEKNCPVYVHCWGGHGRTGTIATCWLMEQGLSYSEALHTIRQARLHDPYLSLESSPRTDIQREFSRQWLELKNRKK